MQAKKYQPRRQQKGAEFKRNALKRLRERWEEENDGEEWEPEKEPIVSTMFAAVEGGRKRVLEALRAHAEDDARSFIETYERCSATDLKHLSFEAIAHAAGIGSLRLAEISQTALFLHASMQTKMLISGGMPKVMKSIIKAATDEVPITASGFDGKMRVVGHTNGDVKAMVLFGQISGMAPVPKGNTTMIQNNFGAEKEESEEKSTPMWRTAEERLREIHDATEPKRLPSPESRPITIGGRLDHMQEETIHILRDE